MSQALVRFEVNDSRLSEAIKSTIGVTVMTEREGFETQMRLLCGDLIQATPPFSGKKLERMLDAQGKALKDDELQDLSAQAVGNRRVERDIRKVIFGVKNPTRQEAPAVHLGQDRNKVYSQGAITDWGTFQKCQGQDAIRVFATKSGTVYGVDVQHFIPTADFDAFRKAHEQARGRRGRVSSAGQSAEKVIGRWKWLNGIITKEEFVQQYIKLRQEGDSQGRGGVGEGRGGWAKGFVMLGGKMSRRGWVGKHMDAAGECYADFTPGNVNILVVNRSTWASGGDPDRIIPWAMEGRAKRIALSLKYAVEKAWNGK